MSDEFFASFFFSSVTCRGVSILRNTVKVFIHWLEIFDWPIAFPRYKRKNIVISVHICQMGAIANKTTEQFAWPKKLYKIHPFLRLVKRLATIYLLKTNTSSRRRTGPAQKKTICFVRLEQSSTCYFQLDQNVVWILSSKPYVFNSSMRVVHEYALKELDLVSAFQSYS